MCTPFGLAEIAKTDPYYYIDHGHQIILSHTLPVNNKALSRAAIISDVMISLQTFVFIIGSRANTGADRMSCLTDAYVHIRV